VLAGLHRGLLNLTDSAGRSTPGTNQTGHAYYERLLLVEMNCSDPIETMFALQLSWCHARIAKLSSQAAYQENRATIAVINAAIDSAHNQFRRLALGLREYRRPNRAEPSFTAIRQLNAAQQQVIANGPSPQAEKLLANEQGSPALPPVIDGTAIPAIVGTEESTMAVEHRPQNDGGQGALAAERLEARPALRGGATRAARVGGAAGDDAKAGARRGRNHHNGMTTAGPIGRDGER
jgi:hypothetical protein